MLVYLKNLYHLLQSLIANIKAGFPAKGLIIIGVTGTDGKTTSTSMIYHVLKENGFKVAMVSTLHAKIGDQLIDTGLHVTTPEPWQLPKIFKEMKKQGVEYVVLESTSQGLAQNRLFGVKFDTSLITNIGHDHLDYHRTWERYAEAKFKLIQKTKQEGIFVVNKDHLSFKWIKKKYEESKSRLPQMITFSKSEVKGFESNIEGIKFNYDSQQFKLNLIGDYNLENSLGVIKLCTRYLNLKQIAQGLESFQSPKGRMQLMKSKPYSVIVDFAHTPSSLERALNAVINVKPKPDSKIICVFGCAGLRDVSRRNMGGVSAKLADITLVSLEDPRIEKVKNINDEILNYAENAGGKIIARFVDHEDYLQNKTKVAAKIKNSNLEKLVISFDYDDVQNRIDAVDFGFNIIKENDILFVTGKGHEESLAIGDPIVEYPYTDQETISKMLNLK